MTHYHGAASWWPGIAPRAMAQRVAAVLGALIAVALPLGAAAGQEMTGKVIYTDDGDTVWMLVADKQRVKIRLASIDAPETGHEEHEKGRVGQPYSREAKQRLEALLKGRTVRAECPDYDYRYQRWVCVLLVDGVNANAQMVREGWAWANTSARGRYLRDRSLLELQRQAQQARVGLWAGAHPVPPWEWRRTCWEEGVCGQ